MVMGDGAAVAQDRVGRSGLDGGPLLELGATTARGHYRVVGCRPIRVDVREAARHLAAATHVTDRVAGDSHHGFVKRGYASPGGGRPEGPAPHAGRDEGVAEIGRIEEGAAPGTGRTLASALVRRAGAAGIGWHPPSVIARALEGACHPGIQAMIRGLE